MGSATINLNDGSKAMQTVNKMADTGRKGVGVAAVGTSLIRQLDKHLSDTQNKELVNKIVNPGKKKKKKQPTRTTPYTTPTSRIKPGTSKSA